MNVLKPIRLADLRHGEPGKYVPLFIGRVAELAVRYGPVASLPTDHAAPPRRPSGPPPACVAADPAFSAVFLLDRPMVRLAAPSLVRAGTSGPDHEPQIPRGHRRRPVPGRPREDQC